MQKFVQYTCVHVHTIPKAHFPYKHTANKFKLYLLTPSTHIYYTSVLIYHSKMTKI